MRTLSTTLKNAQQAQIIDALVKLVLTYNSNSYTYTRDRIIDINRKESGSLQSMEVMLDNSDGAITSLDFQGYTGVLSMGAITGAGEEYSPYAPMIMTAQRFDSIPGKLVCKLSLLGICNLLAEDKASEAYIPDEEDTKTNQELINEILGATLPCYSHCQAYTVDWDSTDGIINTYQPKDSFRIYVGGNRLSAVNRLLENNKCLMRVESDGHIHIFVPQTSGTNYDYEYSLTSGHTFFSKAYRKRLVIPNYIKVESDTDDDPKYSGYSVDSDSFSRLPKYDFYRMHLDSDEQATDIAEAILSKAKMWCEAGSADVPLNVGAEVFDYVKVTDERENDYRIGNIGRLTVNYTANKNEWRMTFTFGNWLSVRSVLEDMGITGDDLEAYFPRLTVKDLYAENILAKNCDFVWIDPENNIDLSKIGDDLDNLPDGEVYARVKSLHLDAGQIKLDENILYKSGYDPSTKWEGSDLDDLPDGTVYQRVKSVALTAGGMVLLDQVVAGTYGLVKSTDISAGHILLSKTYKDGEWYKTGGVKIDADYGIVIYGQDKALVTRASEFGTDQCYVGADGKIYAGGGNICLASDGLTIKGAELMFKTPGGSLQGYLGYYSESIFLMEADINDWFWFYVPGSNGAVWLDAANIYLDGLISEARVDYRMKIPVGTNMYG